MKVYPNSRVRRCLTVVGALVLVALAWVCFVYLGPRAVRQRELRAELISAARKVPGLGSSQFLESVCRRYQPIEVATALLELMESSDPGIRHRAISVPGGWHDIGLPWDWPAVHRHVRELLKDDHSYVRVEAAATVLNNWSWGRKGWDRYGQVLRTMATTDPVPRCRGVAGFALASMGDASGLETVIDQIPLVSYSGEVAECVAWLDATIDPDARAGIDYGEFASFIHWGMDPRLLKHAPEVAQLWLEWYEAHKDKLHYDAEHFRWTLDRGQGIDGPVSGRAPVN